MGSEQMRRREGKREGEEWCARPSCVLSVRLATLILFL